LALPAPSKHPEGSIEWWLDQIGGAGDRARMDDIRAAALAAHVDQGEDAGAFRRAYSDRARELREGGQP
jgi:hypothetical protein